MTVEADAMQIHNALKATGLGYSAMSWNGYNLFGNADSIAELKRLLHNSDTRLPEIERMLREATANP